MSYKKKIISLLYYPYRVFKKIKSLFSDKNRTSVRVLLFHDIPLNEKDSFKEKILFLSKRWKFISAETFTKYSATKFYWIVQSFSKVFTDTDEER